jgi:TPP-dependent 2-oxoacid decarboxylase
VAKTTSSREEVVTKATASQESLKAEVDVAEVEVHSGVEMTEMINISLTIKTTTGHLAPCTTDRRFHSKESCHRDSRLNSPSMKTLMAEILTTWQIKKVEHPCSNKDKILPTTIRIDHSKQLKPSRIRRCCSSLRSKIKRTST